MNAWTLLPALLAITIDINALVVWALNIIVTVVSAFIVIPFAIEFAQGVMKSGTVDWVGLGSRVVTLIVATALITNMVAVINFFKTLVVVTAS